MPPPHPDSVKLAELIPSLMQKVAEGGHAAQPVDPSKFGNVVGGFRVQLSNTGVIPQPSAMVYVPATAPSLCATMDGITKTVNRGDYDNEQALGVQNPAVDAMRTALNEAIQALGTPLRFERARWQEMSVTSEGNARYSRPFMNAR